MLGWDQSVSVFISQFHKLTNEDPTFHAAHHLLNNGTSQWKVWVVLPQLTDKDKIFEEKRIEFSAPKKDEAKKSVCFQACLELKKRNHYSGPPIPDVTVDGSVDLAKELNKVTSTNAINKLQELFAKLEVNWAVREDEGSRQFNGTGWRVRITTPPLPKFGIEKEFFWGEGRTVSDGKKEAAYQAYISFQKKLPPQIFEEGKKAYDILSQEKPSEPKAPRYETIVSPPPTPTQPAASANTKADSPYLLPTILTPSPPSNTKADSPYLLPTSLTPAPPSSVPASSLASLPSQTSSSSSPLQRALSAQQKKTKKAQEEEKFLLIEIIPSPVFSSDLFSDSDDDDEEEQVKRPPSSSAPSTNTTPTTNSPIKFSSTPSSLSSTPTKSPPQSISSSPFIPSSPSSTTASPSKFSLSAPPWTPSSSKSSSPFTPSPSLSYTSPNNHTQQPILTIMTRPTSSTSTSSSSSSSTSLQNKWTPSPSLPTVKKEETPSPSLSSTTSKEQLHIEKLLTSLLSESNVATTTEERRFNSMLQIVNYLYNENQELKARLNSFT